MRVLLLLTVALAGSVGFAEEIAKDEAATVKECSSCTARHKSLQELQEVHVPSEPDEDEAEQTDQEDD